jgi:hypothetical protein
VIVKWEDVLLDKYEKLLEDKTQAEALKTFTPMQQHLMVQRMLEKETSVTFHDDIISTAIFNSDDYDKSPRA